MKKSLMLLLCGVLTLGVSYAQDENGNLSKEGQLKTVKKHIMGRDLVKGTWGIGGTLSAKSHSLSDLDLLIADVANFDQRSFNVRTEGSYFVKDYLSVGLGLQYGESKLDLDAGFLNNSYTRNLRNFNRSYGVLGFIKNHIPLSSKNIFYVTNQTELYYGYENGPSETVKNDILERKYATKHSLGVGIRPGILVFFTKNFAFDVNMGVLGFSHSKEDVGYTYPPNNLPPESEQKQDTRNNSTSVNLKFDLLKVGFGFSYYL